jgi:hypothetical protein
VNVPATSADSDLSARVTALELATQAVQERLTDLAQGLAELRRSHGRAASGGNDISASPLAQLRDLRLAVALMRLGIATRGHQPFAREVELARQIGRDEIRLRSPLDTLAAHAATGVATVPELRDSFGILLLPKLQALLKSTQTSWLDRTRGWLSAAIAPGPAPSIQRSAQPAALQLVTAALDKLTEDDLRGAVEQLSQLDGIEAALTARWLAEANARLAVDAAYESITGTAVALLGRSPDIRPQIGQHEEQRK